MAAQLQWGQCERLELSGQADLDRMLRWLEIEAARSRALWIVRIQHDRADSLELELELGLGHPERSFVWYRCGVSQAYGALPGVAVWAAPILFERGGVAVSYPPNTTMVTAAAAVAAAGEFLVSGDPPPSLVWPAHVSGTSAGAGKTTGRVLAPVGSGPALAPTEVLPRVSARAASEPGPSRWLHRLPVADDFFLTAHDHDVTGRPRLSDRVCGIGLTAALLSELVLAGRLTIEPVSSGAMPHHRHSRVDVDRRGARPRVLDDAELDNPEASGLLAMMAAAALRADDVGAWGVRDWLSFGAAEGQAWRLVGGRLARAGLVRRQDRRRLLRGTELVFVPINSNVSGWPSIRVAEGLSTDRGLDEADIVLGCLLVATGLDQQWWDLSTADRQRLGHLLTGVREPLRLLVHEAEAAVSSAVLTYST